MPIHLILFETVFCAAVLAMFSFMTRLNFKLKYHQKVEFNFISICPCNAAVALCETKLAKLN